MLEPTENDTQRSPDYSKIIAAIEKKFGAKFKLAKSAFRGGAVLPDLPFSLLSRGIFLLPFHFYFFGGIRSQRLGGSETHFI